MPPRKKEVSRPPCINLRVALTWRWMWGGLPPPDQRLTAPGPAIPGQIQSRSRPALRRRRGEGAPPGAERHGSGWRGRERDGEARHPPSREVGPPQPSPQAVEPPQLFPEAGPPPSSPEAVGPPQPSRKAAGPRRPVCARLRPAPGGEVARAATAFSRGGAATVPAGHCPATPPPARPAAQAARCGEGRWR